ncbi:MAG: sigma-70 family RNA polymerase sigma factor [Pseudomonadales bacterium]|nr:sigma-70 family RNA polymerase sigma factor [Pseudomonadales bacterium]
MGDHAITLLKEHNSGSAGKAPTFDELYNDHHVKVLKAAFRVTGNLQDAEDVLQTVFLRLLKRQDRPELGANSAGYLCKAAINAGLDLLRARNRTQTETLNDEIHHSQNDAADSDVRQAEHRKHLRSALLSLDQHAAEVFALRYFEDFGNADIANLLDTSPNSIAVTLHRTRERLQKILGELEGESR